MSQKYSWAIEDIYDSIESWEKDFKYVEDNLDFIESRILKSTFW